MFEGAHTRALMEEAMREIMRSLTAADAAVDRVIERADISESSPIVQTIVEITSLIVAFVLVWGVCGAPGLH